MNRTWLFVVLLATGVVLADDAPETKPAAADAGAKAKPAKDAKQPGADAKPAKEDAKALLGISILGNQEAPKALVIVPWKSSEIGASLGVSTMLDDSRQPIDKDVFMRVLSYYEVMSNTTRHDGAPAGSRDPSAAGKRDAAQPSGAAHRR